MFVALDIKLIVTVLQFFWGGGGGGGGLHQSRYIIYFDAAPPKNCNTVTVNCGREIKILFYGSSAFLGRFYSFKTLSSI